MKTTPDKIVKTPTAKSKVSVESSGTIGVGVTDALGFGDSEGKAVGVTFEIWVRAKIWVAGARNLSQLLRLRFR